MADPQELREEQDYFDNAAEHRERMRGRLGRAPSTAAHPGAAVKIKGEVRAALAKLRRPDEAVAFGRSDGQDGTNFYIGYDGIHDDGYEALVVSWKAPAAAAFYEARVGAPHGLTRRRQYRMDRNTILDFEDLLFDQIVEEIERLDEPVLTDTLLDELKRHRTGEMQDIARTIQAAQYEVIREKPNQLLIVQGGPGTGKTAIALHRVSWLIYNEEWSTDDVLIVGPSPTFIRYVDKVLPMLGDERVRHVAVGSLFPGIRPARDEEPAVSRLKGEPRMERLLTHGLRDRIGTPTEDVRIRAGGRSGPLLS